MKNSKKNFNNNSNNLSKFCLDANIFIDSYKRYYPFDLFPTFWELLEKLANKNIVISTISIYNEIAKNEDKLADWCKKNKKMFKDIRNEDNPDSQKYFGCIIEIIRFIKEKYTSKKAEEFLGTLGESENNADIEVIAYSKVYGYIVVTFEGSAGNIESTVVRKGPEIGKYNCNVKIPDICNFFNVECINLFEMLKIIKEEYKLDNICEIENLLI
ncbi:MAG: DUF4411 family protein [bacterium]